MRQTQIRSSTFYFFKKTIDSPFNSSYYVINKYETFPISGNFIFYRNWKRFKKGGIRVESSPEVVKQKGNTKEKSSKWEYVKKHRLLYLMLAPGLLLTLVFKYIPMYGILLAFKDYNPLRGIWGSDWVGLDNFRQFIISPNFGMLLENTLKISIYGLLLGFFPPVILAISLNQILSTKWKKRFQLILYAPNFISLVIVVGMLFMFLSANGPINSLIESLTGHSIRFMSEPSYFRSIYIASGIWQGMGWASVLYTATLSNVSQDLIDASFIDGANIFQRIWYIDLPTLRPIMVIQFILSVGGIMNVGYEKAFLMQTPMNLPTSEIISTYVYKVGLQMGDYGYSTAVGLFNTVINVILLLLVNTIANKISDDGSAL
ncbi:sugar ABC transporter permease [Jeotgalibaca porci]|uniref:Sugar ABC transporter permease n=1 Tax=Jeotgalibaca porci TaxID=1868793 RepID=A0A6G7WHX6_9LACT|nr:sugar ABC transporter permease [Jeotgalibaca porci]